VLFRAPGVALGHLVRSRRQEHEIQGPGAQVGKKLAQPRSDYNVIDHDAEAGLKERIGQEAAVAAAQAQLAYRFLPWLAVWPKSACHDELLEKIGLDVDAAVEALSQQARQGGLAGARYAGDEENRWGRPNQTRRAVACYGRRFSLQLQ